MKTGDPVVVTLEDGREFLTTVVDVLLIDNVAAVVLVGADDETVRRVMVGHDQSRP